MTSRRVAITPVSWKRGNLTIRGSMHVASGTTSPWVIFSHGFTGQRMGPDFLYVKISRALAQCGVSSLRFDDAGSGESDGRFSDMTVSTMAADLLSAVAFVRRARRPSQLILLGHSLGGAVAALTCVKARADGLILLAPVGDPVGLLKRRKDTVLRAGMNKNGYYENGPHEMSADFINDIKRQLPLRALEGFHGSMILFQGDHDKSIALSESGRYIEWAQDAALDAERHVLEGSDHNFLTVSAVEYLCTTMSAWVRDRFL